MVRILVRRAYKFCNIEAEEVVDSPMTQEEKNNLRKGLALIVDEGIRELKKTITEEEEYDQIVSELLKLEEYVEDYPLTEDGLFDVSQMKPEEIKRAKRYRKLCELASTHKPYMYDDDSNSLLR